MVAAALALTGRAASAATLTPLSAICADGIENALVAWGLPLSGIAAIVAAGGNLSERFRLDRLFRLICGDSPGAWALLIAGLRGPDGPAGAAGRGPGRRSTGRACRRSAAAMPIIGGEVSDSGALVGSAIGRAQRRRASPGCWRWPAPPCRPASGWRCTLSLKLAAAVIEPVADPGITRVAGFGDIAELLLAICAAGAVLALVLLGGSSPGPVGSTGGVWQNDRYVPRRLHGNASGRLALLSVCAASALLETLTRDERAALSYRALCALAVAAGAVTRAVWLLAYETKGTNRHGKRLVENACAARGASRCFAALALAALLALALIGGAAGREGDPAKTELEARVERILSRVEGAGRVSAMITQDGRAAPPAR